MGVHGRVKPGASRTAVGGRYGDALVVAVSARAVDGKATGAALRAVADAFGVPRRDVTLVIGATSRDKFLEITGAPQRWRGDWRRSSYRTRQPQAGRAQRWSGRSGCVSRRICGKHNPMWTLPPPLARSGLPLARLRALRPATGAWAPLRVAALGPQPPRPGAPLSREPPRPGVPRAGSPLG